MRPLRYGLLSAANLITDLPDHWEAGIDFQPDPCDPANATLDECPSGDTSTKTATTTGLGARGAEPFTVYAWLSCSPVGLFDQYRARVSAALTNGEARAVETVFWTGTALGGTVEPHLAEDTAVVEAGSGIVMQTAATVVTGAPVDVIRAVGLLEGELAECYGGEGVIHVPRVALAVLGAYNLVERDGPRLRTLGGTVVAAGAGYPGTSPGGAAPAAGTAWFYATGAVDVRRSDIRFTSTPAEALGRAENSMILIAERTYVAAWDCCHFAALANLVASPGSV